MAERFRTPIDNSVSLFYCNFYESSPVILYYSAFGSYDLHLTPDLEAFTFTGVCDITFDIDPVELRDADKKEITLHAKELCFVSADYIVLDGTVATATPPTPVHAEEITISTLSKTVKFAFGKSIPSTATKIKLTIQYSGFLNNQMAGFYRSHYTDITGQSKIMASTQFESLDARRCFPCVDEPAVKAVFRVSLTVATHLHVLSNMPVQSHETLTVSHKRVTFLDTPVMSTYLLAVCVGEFDCVQTVTAHGVVVSVYTPPGKSHMGTFALSVAARALDAYDDFFQIHFPLPKLDMIAIPEFAMGAMEVSSKCGYFSLHPVHGRWRFLSVGERDAEGNANQKN